MDRVHGITHLNRSLEYGYNKIDETMAPYDLCRKVFISTLRPVFEKLNELVYKEEVSIRMGI